MPKKSGIRFCILILQPTPCLIFSNFPNLSVDSSESLMLKMIPSVKSNRLVSSFANHIPCILFSYLPCQVNSLYSTECKGDNGFLDLLYILMRSISTFAFKKNCFLQISIPNLLSFIMAICGIVSIFSINIDSYRFFFLLWAINLKNS